MAAPLREPRPEVELLDGRERSSLLENRVGERLVENAKAGNVTRYSAVYVTDPVQIRIGARVAAFKARGIFGKEVDFEALVRSRRPVILASWSKYCKACVEQFRALGIKFLPTIIAVDARGRVLDFYHKFDEAGEAEILAGIETLVQKAVATAPRITPATPAAANP